MDQTIADRVRMAREAAGIGSRELDQLAHLTPGHTAMIEGRKGKAGLGAETALKLAKALGVPLDWLITGEGKSPFRGKRAAVRA